MSKTAPSLEQVIDEINASIPQEELDKEPNHRYGFAPNGHFLKGNTKQIPPEVAWHKAAFLFVHGYSDEQIASIIGVKVRTIQKLRDHPAMKERIADVYARVNNDLFERNERWNRLKNNVLQTWEYALDTENDVPIQVRLKVCETIAKLAFNTDKAQSPQNNTAQISFSGTPSEGRVTREIKEVGQQVGAELISLRASSSEEGNQRAKSIVSEVKTFVKSQEGT